jgi:hypothetical protein
MPSLPDWLIIGHQPGYSALAQAGHCGTAVAGVTDEEPEITCGIHRASAVRHPADGGRRTADGGDEPGSVETRSFRR